MHPELLKSTNMLIIPYTTEKEYKNNVDEILTYLLTKINKENIILTEGEDSYIHKRHDVIEYAIKYDLEHRNHEKITSMINYGAWKDKQFIVCIGTWSTDIVSGNFSYHNPEVQIIHIQGPILPEQYKIDRFERLEICEVTVDELKQIYNCRLGDK